MNSYEWGAETADYLAKCERASVEFKGVFFEDIWYHLMPHGLQLFSEIRPKTVVYALRVEEDGELKAMFRGRLWTSVGRINKV